MGHKEKVFIGGQEAPSVTQVINVIDKPFLKLWYGKHGTAECQRILKASQETGKLVHSAIEAYFRGDALPDLPAKEAAMFALMRTWAIESRFTPVELEVHVMSEQFGYHGTADTLGSFDGGPLVIGDWKTSSGIGDDYGIQLAAYAQAYKEQTGKEVTEGFIVRVDKKGAEAKVPFEVKRFTELPRYFEVFKSCLDLWRFTNHKGTWAKK